MRQCVITFMYISFLFNSYQNHSENVLLISYWIIYTLLFSTWKKVWNHLNLSVLPQIFSHAANIWIRMDRRRGVSVSRTWEPYWWHTLSYSYVRNISKLCQTKIAHSFFLLQFTVSCFFVKTLYSSHFADSAPSPTGFLLHCNHRCAGNTLEKYIIMEVRTGNIAVFGGVWLIYSLEV